MTTAPLPTEVLDHIAPFLDLPDFALLARVCKEWHQIWTRHLWRSIHVRHDDHLDPFNSSEATKSRLQHGKHIRALHVYNFSLAEQIMLDTTIRLHTLDLLDTSRTLGLYSSQPDILIQILQKSPTLVTLKLAECPLEYERFLCTIIEYLPRLKTLDVLDAEMAQIPKLNEETVKTFLANAPSSIEYIQMAVHFHDSEDWDAMNEPWLSKYYSKTTSHPTLTVVSFNGHMGDRVPLVLSEDFLQSAPKLKAIEFLQENIPRTDWVTSGALHKTIQRATSRSLKRLASSVILHFPDMDIAQLITTGQGNRGNLSEVWYSLDLEGCKNAGAATSQAIVKTCPQDLTELSVVGCEAMGSQDLQAILSTAVDLRVLDASRISDDDDGESYLCPGLLAQDMLLSTWACKWLRTLSIEICGIPRPDIQENQYGEPIPEGHPMHSGTDEESHVIQRKIYRQLGSLVYLEELYLGNSHGENQLNCLSMTLESGLDLLDGLLALRVLGVGKMHHRIETADHDWMWRTWCRLETILGL
ncbi:hypothetical protein BGZ95_005404 [Linnemannia exigua]|uniref:F-box domain-containing protein n=1 Tax=Linnemannia exigua TaxID=604196 RepID=A0AAD4DLF5_9FUNG|nr:hypothetical protein BGZ95_005404 [Linnemannia exigua]